MSPQPPSENSPTLENKAFPIIDLHGQSQEMPLVGDEGLEAFGSSPLFNRPSPVLVKQLGAQSTSFSFIRKPDPIGFNPFVP